MKISTFNITTHPIGLVAILAIVSVSNAVILYILNSLVSFDNNMVCLYYRVIAKNRITNLPLGVFDQNINLRYM